MNKYLRAAIIGYWVSGTSLDVISEMICISKDVIFWVINDHFNNPPLTGQMYQSKK